MTNDILECSEQVREAEKFLLGSILIHYSYNPPDNMMAEITALVKPEDFRGYWHGKPIDQMVQNVRIYTAMLNCKEPTKFHVAKELERMGILQKGDLAYLCELVAECPTSWDYLYYAKAVHEYSMKRQAEYLAKKGDFKKLKELTRDGNTLGPVPL